MDKFMFDLFDLVTDTINVVSGLSAQLTEQTKLIVSLTDIISDMHKDIEALCENQKVENELD